MNLPQLYDQFTERLRSLYDENEARSIARILFEDLAGVPFLALRTDPSYPLSPQLLNRLNRAVDRAAVGEPVQYIVGEVTFGLYDLTLNVTPAVLIPRPETEEWLRFLIAKIRQKSGYPLQNLLEIGTGSGCIALTLASAFPSVRVTATDLSPDALAVARTNAETNGLSNQISFIINDALNEDFPPGNPHKYDLLVSNPPYVPTADRDTLHINVVKYEPNLALFADTELIFYEKIAEKGPDVLRSGGAIALEVHAPNADRVADLLTQKNFTDVDIFTDLNGRPRMVYGFRK